MTTELPLWWAKELPAIQVALCLKPASSMSGIKGDMAGGAAVAGAVYALAKNRIPVNVTGVIPMVENRLSDGSLLPGDVIRC